MPNRLIICISTIPWHQVILSKKSIARCAHSPAEANVARYATAMAICGTEPAEVELLEFEAPANAE